MNLSIRHWTLPLTATAICLGIAFLGEPGRQALRYLGSGAEFNLSDISYRWLAGHFTHVGWGHFALNIVGLLSIWAIYGSVIRTRAWLVFFLLCPIGTSLGFNIFSPQTAYYVGLSGVLHGMLAVAVFVRLLQHPSASKRFSLARNWEEVLVLTGLWAKIIYEQSIGAVPMTAKLAGDTVVVDAHLYGACIGTVFAILLSGYAYINYKICRNLNLPTAD